VAWKIEGRYFENCPCNVVCPCTASLTLGADVERCQPVLVFHIESGDVEGVDVGGLTVLAVADTPRVMSEGNWRIGMVIDDKASDEQADKLGAVFGGQLGGPMEAMSPLIGEMMGIERAAIEFSETDHRHSVKAGDMIDIEVEDVVPFGSETGEPARMEAIFHPVGSTLTVSQAAKAKVKIFGMDVDRPGTSGFSTSKFSWSA